MNHQDALSRQRSLRDGQSARARIFDGTVDRAQLAHVAEIDGVPARYSNISRGDLKELAPAAYDVAVKATDAMMDPTGDWDGLVIYGASAHYAGRLSGALYSGAMVRNRAARWYNFPEMADNFTRKIQLDTQREWDIGEVTTWNDDLDSARYCYDLVVIHGLTRQLLTPYVSTELYKILAARSVRGLFTVLGARLAEKDDLFHDGPAIKSLITDQFLKHPETSDAGE